MPRTDDVSLDTLYLSARELGERLRAGKLSSEALTQAYLERLEKLGPRLGAVVTTLRDRAVQEARAADAELRAGRWRGPLHGVPYGVKDLLAARGALTTWGAEPYRRQVFDDDATVVRRLREAGAVLIAKLAMVELAGAFGYDVADASFTGPGRTPWNLEHWSGGSSTGSGAAVAAGLVGFAIGSETSGSIVTPAAFCGVAGLRPTYGRVSRHGAMALCWSLDKLGPMARTAEDCALVLAAVAGKDRLDPTASARSFAWPEPGAKAKFRIGILADATDRVQPEVRRNFEASLAVLATFAELVPDVRLPALPFSEVISLIVRAEGAAAFRDLIDSGGTAKLRAPADRWGGQAGSMVLAVDYLEALRARGPMKKALDGLYARFDAIVAPSRSAVAPPIRLPFAKAHADGAFGPAISQLVTAGNAVGQPALCLPNGFGQKGLPTGIQLTGRAWGEARLLAIGTAYQRATDWHRRRPPEP